MAAPRSSCLPPSSRAAPRFVRWCRDPVCRSALLRGHLRYGLQMELLTDISVYYSQAFVYSWSQSCLFTMLFRNGGFPRSRRTISHTFIELPELYYFLWKTNSVYILDSSEMWQFLPVQNIRSHILHWSPSQITGAIVYVCCTKCSIEFPLGNCTKLL